MLPSLVALAMVFVATQVAWLISLKGQQLVSKRHGDAIEAQSKAIEKLQKQVAKLAANQLDTQKSVDELMGIPAWQKQAEEQIDILKAELAAKTKAIPQVRLSKWAQFRANVEGNVDA